MYIVVGCFTVFDKEYYYEANNSTSKREIIFSSYKKLMYEIPEPFSFDQI
jgi:hypothetical protein